MNSTNNFRRIVILCVLTSLLTLLHYSPYPAASVLFKSWDSHVLAIEKAINVTIPHTFITDNKPVMIEYMPNEEVERAIKFIYNEDIKATGYLGFYLPKEQHSTYPNIPQNGSLIILVGHSSAELEEYVVTHEYGHHVYFELLTKNEREWWTLQWFKEAVNGNLPTNYSYSNSHEGFAEVFAGYVHRDSKVSKEDVKFLDGIGRRLDRRYRGIPVPQIDNNATLVTHTEDLSIKLSKTSSCTFK